MNNPIRIICVIEGGIPTFFSSESTGVNITVLDNDQRAIGELNEQECEQIERQIQTLTEIVFDEPARADEGGDDE
jgi:hypothetical protein